MNNKGMTLVELLVTFTLLMVVVVGMFNLILDVKGDLDVKQATKEFVELSNFMNHDIHMDLLKRKPFAIAIRKVDTDPTSNLEGRWRCEYASGVSTDTGGECKINQSTKKFSVKASFKVEDKNVSVQAEQSLSNVCHGFYPCAVYAYYDEGSSSKVKFQTIAISKWKKNEDGFGIKYGDKFEKMPSQKYVNFLKSGGNILLEGGFFIVDYPLYVTGDDTNYGFKIVYPFGY